MPINQGVYQALAGSGLSAQDYAGLTPEQIQMVAQQGTHDRQLISGVISDMRQQDAVERKQNYEEMHQDRVFKIMQRQDARQEFETLHNAMLNDVKIQMEKRKLALDEMQTRSSLANNALARKQAQVQLAGLKKNMNALDSMQNVTMQIPGFNDEKGQPIKMTIGQLSAVGVLDKAITAGLQAKFSGGESKEIQKRKFLGEKARALGASDRLVDVVEMVGPELFKGNSRGVVYQTLSKNDPMFNMLSPDEKQKRVDQDMGIINLLGISVADELGREQVGVVEGADVPGGTVPKPTAQQIEDLLNE